MTTMAEATEIDGYALEPPAEPWGYVIDGVQVTYRRGLVAQRLRPGWWPFAFADPEQEHRERRYQLAGPVAQECGVAYLRLGPDCANYAWRNEYVIAGPDRQVPHLAHASAHLWIAPRRVLSCEIHLNLKEQTYEVAGLPEDVPAEVRAQTDSKGRKLVAFLARACAERDGSERAAPVTSADLEVERAARRTERIRACCTERGLTFKPCEYSDTSFTIAGERMSIVDVEVRFRLGLFERPGGLLSREGVPA